MFHEITVDLTTAAEFTNDIFVKPNIMWRRYIISLIPIFVSLKKFR